MRDAVRWAAVGLLVCLLLNGCACTTPSGEPASFPLDAVVKDVKAAVDKYQIVADKDGLRQLDSAEFTFNVVRNTSGGLSVTAQVFNFGWTRSCDVEHTVTYTYEAEPPKKGFVRIEEHFDPESLTQLIISAAQAAQAAPQNLENLPLNKMAIEVKFAIKNEVKASGGPTFSVVTLGANVSASKSTTQSAKLTFKHVKPKA